LNFTYYYDHSIFNTVDTEGPYELYKDMREDLRKRNVYFIDSPNELNMALNDHVIFLHANGSYTENSNNILDRIKKGKTLRGQHYYELYFDIYEYTN
jgi:hypothetical protein